MRNDLALAFLEYSKKRKEADWVQRLCQVAELGMWPFKTGEITISRYEEGFMGSDMTFRIDVQAVPEHVFRYKIDERQVVAAYFPEEFIFESMAPALLTWFRYRPSLPVDDHIVLGEE